MAERKDSMDRVHAENGQPNATVHQASQEQQAEHTANGAAPNQRQARLYTEEEVRALLQRQQAVGTFLLQAALIPKPSATILAKNSASPAGAPASSPSQSAAKKPQTPKPLQPAQPAQPASINTKIEQQLQAAFDIALFERNFMAALIQPNPLNHIQALLQPLLEAHAKKPNKNLSSMYVIALNKLILSKLHPKLLYECLQYLLNLLDKITLISHNGKKLTKEEELHCPCPEQDGTFSVLARAFMYADPSIIQLLLQHKANPFVEDVDYRNGRKLSSFLMLARQKPEELKTIFTLPELIALADAQNARLKLQLPIHYQGTEDGINLFMVACGFGNIPMIQHLWKLDPELHLKVCNDKAVDQGYDAFMFAASCNQVTVLKFLHEKYPDFIKVRLASGCTALSEAARYSSPQHSNLEAMQCLIAWGGEGLVNYQGGPSHTSALHRAALGEHVAAIRCLLESGAALGRCDSANANELSIAASGSDAHAYLLGAHRLTAIVRNNEILLEGKLSAEGLALLKQYPVNLRDFHRNTLIQLAIACPNLRDSIDTIFSHLILQGADLLATNDDKHNAFDKILLTKWHGDPIKDYQMKWERVFEAYRLAVQRIEEDEEVAQEGAVAALKSAIQTCVQSTEKCWQDKFTRNVLIERFYVLVHYEPLFKIDTKFYVQFANFWGNCPQPNPERFKVKEDFNHFLAVYKLNMDRLAHLVLDGQIVCSEKRAQALGLDQETTPTTSEVEFTLGGRLLQTPASLDHGLPQHETKGEAEDEAQKKNRLKQAEGEVQKQNRLKYAQQFFYRAENFELGHRCFFETADADGTLFDLPQLPGVVANLPKTTDIAVLLPALALALRQRFTPRGGVAGHLAAGAVVVANGREPIQRQPTQDTAQAVTFSTAGTVAAQGATPGTTQETDSVTIANIVNAGSQASVVPPSTNDEPLQPRSGESKRGDKKLAA